MRTFRLPALLAAIFLAPAFSAAAPTDDSFSGKAVKKARALAESAKRLDKAGARKFKVLLDPGHTPAKPGAISSQGLFERSYNQDIAALLLKSLAAEADTEVLLTNGPDQTVENAERPKLANKLGVDLFLSIHHDSAQPVYFSTWTFEGAERQYCDKFQGFSFHLATDRPASKQSLAFAKLAGARLAAAGFSPTLHHAEPIAGENRKLLDRGLGIYERNELTVLKTNDRPAVLFECGVIIHREEERRMQDPAVRSRLVEALVQAVREFRKSRD